MKTITFKSPCKIGDIVYTVESVVNADCDFSLWDWEV